MLAGSLPGESSLPGLGFIEKRKRGICFKELAHVLGGWQVRNWPGRPVGSLGTQGKNGYSWESKGSQEAEFSPWQDSVCCLLRSLTD